MAEAPKNTTEMCKHCGIRAAGTDNVWVVGDSRLEVDAGRRDTKELCFKCLRKYYIVEPLS